MTTAAQPAHDPTPVGKLASISLDTTDPGTLADFYGRLLGMHRIYQRPDGGVIALSDGRIALTVMFAADHIPPTWPDPVSRSNCIWTSPSPTYPEPSWVR